MRSRYSAYATGNYQYILDTYAQQQKQTLSVEALAESDEGTSWLSLEVLRASGHTVEFLATYCADGQYFRMHELSSFVLEEDRWVYLSGDMLGQTGAFKPGRNDLCPCHSGKKFKKCCGRS